MHAAWHFWYAVGFGGESGLRELGLCGIHPLTRRYVYLYFSGLKLLRSLFFAPLAVRSSCLSKSALSAQIREFLNP
ncbi:DUF3265 domain-containing protein [Vibrio vulnificus]|uniref:DUF3265 domain-containing protein n=1 Tax=Vibrio vulnificus TaxID=672 RepID=A0ABX4X0I6_VIBVL|nr:DUF3265 domain-containing protein [Vibrio vulnificus]EGR0054734.1 DUF3265 domain-containing protein [Vibrio vulnificus]EID4343259.1 DUF3265 domain-containing protein [Vibrio vulnificus]EID4377999.1 DUF3265 domain-containing protein [Vibrio vulnificus]PNM69208.1 hypothetical protein AL548_016495 [Vibrio vulnificus]